MKLGLNPGLNTAGVFYSLLIWFVSDYLLWVACFLQIIQQFACFELNFLLHCVLYEVANAYSMQF